MQNDRKGHLPTESPIVGLASDSRHCSLKTCGKFRCPSPISSNHERRQNCRNRMLSSSHRRPVAKGDHDYGGKTGACIFPVLTGGTGGSAGGAAAKQEFAAGFDHRSAVIGDDVGGGVGFAPQLGEAGAVADRVDRRVGGGHHPAFGRAEARAGDDASRRERRRRLRRRR